MVEEMAGAIPRAIDRTQAQVDLVRRVLSVFPCANRSARPLEDAPEGGGGLDGPPPGEGTAREEPEEAGAAHAAGAELPKRAPAAASLAIPDYDSLAASQVVPRLTSLTESELSDVRDYEAAHRSRQTILNRVRQLQADATAG